MPTEDHTRTTEEMWREIEEGLAELVRRLGGSTADALRGYRDEPVERCLGLVREAQRQLSRFPLVIRP